MRALSAATATVCCLPLTHQIVSSRSAVRRATCEYSLYRATCSLVSLEKDLLPSMGSKLHIFWPKSRPRAQSVGFMLLEAIRHWLENWFTELLSSVFDDVCSLDLTSGELRLHALNFRTDLFPPYAPVVLHARPGARRVRCAISLLNLSINLSIDGVELRLRMRAPPTTEADAINAVGEAQLAAVGAALADAAAAKARKMAREAESGGLLDYLLGRLIARVLRNINVRCSDASVRLEGVRGGVSSRSSSPMGRRSTTRRADAGSGSSQQWVVGASVQSLRLLGTDSTWRLALAREGEALTHKVVEVEGFGVYCEPMEAVAPSPRNAAAGRRASNTAAATAEASTATAATAIAPAPFASVWDRVRDFEDRTQEAVVHGEGDAEEEEVVEEEVLLEAMAAVAEEEEEDKDEGEEEEEEDYGSPAPSSPMANSSSRSNQSSSRSLLPQPHAAGVPASRRSQRLSRSPPIYHYGGDNPAERQQISCMCAAGGAKAAAAAEPQLPAM